MRAVLLLLLVVLAACLVEGFRSLKRTTSTNFHCPRNRNVKRSTRGKPLGRVKRSTCDDTEAYRSGDGSCNNLNNPSWGAGGQTYQRLLDPVYYDNETLPRLTESDSDEYLPSPRDISVLVHDFDRERPHARGSVMLMEWGQFLAHDIAATPVDSEDEECCYDELVTEDILHDDVMTGGPCFPIIISEGDRYFTETSSRCMEFVRSYPVYDDDGVRQQMNELSAYIDAQNVYGYDDDEMDELRTFSGGNLIMTDSNNLPESDENDCILEGSDDYCLHAGDSRVNVYPGLGALHTVFARFHNYLATELANNHDDWDDETLFQTARKINIAVIQRITYSEYLPMIIGSDTITEYGLDSDYSYNDSCDATLYNVFATAAFRFGHSMVPDSLLINGSEIESVDLYDRPYHVLNNLDSLISGLVTESAEKADRWYSEGMTDHLFEVDGQDGYDVASLNIQRGRDHGLPSYNEWREFCGFDKITSFDDLISSARYSRSYTSVDDIDLYSGALGEASASSGSVGETYKCLLATQFANLRNCDRFWWETTDSTVGFDDDRQRNQIKKTKLSHVICLTTGITEIQERVFNTVDDDSNPVESCDTLLENSLDISRF